MSKHNKWTHLLHWPEKRGNDEAGKHTSFGKTFKFHFIKV